jgi:hypothetical protein
MADDLWALNGQLPSPPNARPRSTDRLAAIDGALRVLAPSAFGSGTYDANKVTQYATKFEHWLTSAENEQDAQFRRVVLLMVCDKAGENTPADQVRAIAKDLHRYVTRR